MPNAARTQARRRAPNPQLRHAIRIYFRRTRKGTPCFFDDEEGERFLIAMRSLGLPPDQIDRDAPWFRDRTPQDQQRQNDAAKNFDRTPKNIGVMIGLTADDRLKYAFERDEHGKYPMRQLLQITPCDRDPDEWDAELRQREQDKNKRRKAKRLEARAERAARYDRREAAVIDAVIRISHQPGCWHDHSVQSIMRSIERSDDRAFPRKHSTFRVAVHDVLDRLERMGVVTTTTTGKPGRQVRLVSFAMQQTVDATPPSKPLIRQRLAVDKPASDLPDGQGHDGECPDAGAKGLASDEFGATPVPDQTAVVAVEDRPAQGELDVVITKESASDHVNASDKLQREQDMRQAMTKEERERLRIEIIYLRQRITELENQYGGDDDDKPPGDGIEPSRKTVQ